jgi:MCP family monocarboxylic acid transporter-like MFS transporter 10
MVPSQEEPASAARGTSEAQPPGPALLGDAPLSVPGPSDGSEAAAEKVEVELARPAGAEPREPPEGGWGWLVMLAAMWCNGSVLGIQNTCGVLFVSMLKTFASKDDDKMVFKTGEALRPAPGEPGVPERIPSAGRVGAPCAPRWVPVWRRR